jgi:hypothetical protein
MNSDLLGQDPLAGDTYYPQDFEGMLSRVVRIDRAQVESSATPRRRLQLRSRLPIAIAIASLAGASLASAGLAAAASNGGNAPRVVHAGATQSRSRGSDDACGITAEAPPPGPPRWSPVLPGSVPPPQYPCVPDMSPTS